MTMAETKTYKKDKDTQTQTKTKTKVPPRPNVCYIFQKDLNYYIGCPLVMRKTKTKLKYGSVLFFALFPCRHNSLKEEIKTCF